MMLFLAIIIYGLMIVLIAARENEVELTEFELRRRIELGDRRAPKMLLKKQLIPVWNRLIFIETAFLAICLAVALRESFDGWKSLILSLALIISSLFLAKISFVKRPVLKYVHKHSHKFYKLFTALNRRLQLKIIKFGKSKIYTTKIYSTDELLDNLKKSPQILSNEQLDWFQRIIDLNKKIVEIMTPIGNLKVLDEKELLTPIVIDELYRTGQEFFVVVAENNRRAVGVLELAKVTDLTNKTSQIAKNVMSQDFMSIDPQNSGLAVLSELVTAAQQFAVVENDDELVGAINVKDFLK